MAKISELPPITGANTRTEDLFVIVNLVQGDDGTSNITREELVEAIQYEVFSRIKITGGSISGVVMRDSRIDNVQIDNSDIEDTDFKWYAGFGPSVYLSEDFRLGAAGEVGVEYAFSEVPITLGLDFRPYLFLVEVTEFRAGFGFNARWRLN